MSQQLGLSRRVKRLLSPALAMVTMAGASLAFTGQSGAAHAPTASACAYYTNVSLFGGASSIRGCGQTEPPGTAGSASPSVVLPPGGTSTQISATDSDGAMGQYGPAVIFGGHFDANDNVGPSGQLQTTVTGTGTVVSTASAYTVGPAPFSADSVFARCVAYHGGKNFTVQLGGAIVETSTDADGYPLTIVNVPSNPGINYTVPFELNHIGDHGVVVFNERITNGDGSVTLNAVHMYLQGPTAVGDMVIGQARCGA